MKLFQEWRSLNKIFNSNVYCCKNTKQGKYYCKHWCMPACKFIKFLTTPDCYQYNAQHLECQTRISGKTSKVLILRFFRILYL